MAQALECPACGMRHRLDGLVPESTFRCERCGQKLLVPAITSTQARGPSPATAPASSRASSSASSSAAARDAATIAPPPRRTGGAPGSTAVSGGAAAGVTVTLPAAGEAPPRVPPDNGSARSPERDRRKRVAWYWRIVAWVVAIPVGFAIAVLPSYEFGLISKDDVLDVFVGSGTDRYARLALVTLIWAVVTALLVQLFIEGGRWWAARRRRNSSGRGHPRDSAVPVVSS